MDLGFSFNQRNSFREDKGIEINLEDDNLLLDLFMSTSEDLKISIEEGSGGILPYYKGKYNVIPKVKEQKLETKNKSMTDDVTIEKIPFEEVQNPSGGTTVIIGGEL